MSARVSRASLRSQEHHGSRPVRCSKQKNIPRFLRLVAALCGPDMRVVCDLRRRSVADMGTAFGAAARCAELQSVDARRLMAMAVTQTA
eukprot:1187248-Rhodomonas_salina.3